MLREKGVLGKCVEFYGPGLDNMTLADLRPLPTWRQSMVQLTVFSQLIKKHLITSSERVAIRIV